MSGAPSSPLITVDKVNKHFGTAHVLKDVTTHFNAAEVTVILGASGSGKSTLLRTLNRLESHDSGCIRVDGIEVCGDVVTDCRVRTAAGFHWHDAIVGEHSHPPQRFCILGGEDVVGDDDERDLVGEQPAETGDERGLAASHWSADADAQWTATWIRRNFRQRIVVVVVVRVGVIRRQRASPPMFRGARRTRR